jgi:hypothetical protein
MITVSDRPLYTSEITLYVPALRLPSNSLP